MLRTILFDLGNVLLKFSHARMCRQIAELGGISPELLRRELLESPLQLEFERGRMSEAEFQSRLERFCGCVMPIEDLRIAAADIFEPNPGMREIVEQLRERGLRLVLLSNTCVTHIDFIRQKYSLLDLFDDVVLSYEVGALKPEDAIFEAAKSRIQCSPAECFYTDDIAPYVDAGRKQGLQAELFATPHQLRDQLRARGIDLPESRV